MKILVFLSLTAALVALEPAAHAASSEDDQMMKLSPETRIEQRCDAKAMGTVGREQKGYKPEEFVAYAFSDTIIRGNHIKAPGGAIRSKGKWFKLSYDCETSPDGLAVKSFSYRLGAEVPRSEWDEHYLVPR